MEFLQRLKKPAEIYVLLATFIFTEQFDRNLNLEAVEEGACTYANPLMAGKTYTCCDCGDEMHVPTTNCQHDSHDETGSWWRDENGNGVPDLFESYKANVATLLKG